jgi:hypothetical protein
LIVFGADFVDGTTLLAIAVPGLESVAAVGFEDVDFPKVDAPVDFVVTGAGRAAGGGARAY